MPYYLVGVGTAAWITLTRLALLLLTIALIALNWQLARRTFSEILVSLLMLVVLPCWLLVSLVRLAVRAGCSSCPS